MTTPLLKTLLTGKNSDDDESTEERDEVLKMKDKKYGTDSMKTPTRKNGRKDPTPTEYPANKKPKDIYERKSDDSDKEEESKKSTKISPNTMALLILTAMMLEETPPTPMTATTTQTRMNHTIL